MEQIFEPSLDDEIARINSMMETIPEEEEPPEPVKLEVVEKPPAPPAPPPAKKGRKPLTDARKAQLKEQLKRGRETSLAKRRNNGKLTRLKKAKAVVEQEDDIVLSTKSASELRAELKALRAEMNQKQQIKNEVKNPALASSEIEKAPKAKVVRAATPPAPIVVKAPPIDTGPPAWLLNRSKNKYL